MSTTAKTRCPICQEPSGPSAENRSFPFCSQRCKVIDLGKWLSGDYRVPVREEDGGDFDDGTMPPKDDPTVH